jgi:hypothetical protein
MRIEFYTQTYALQCRRLPPPKGVIRMPDTTSTTASNARAAFAAGPLVADLDIGAARIVLRRAVLVASEGTPR